MLNPSRPLVIALLVLSGVTLALGLSTDVGLLGWTAAALIALYLGVVGVAHMARS